MCTKLILVFTILCVSVKANSQEIIEKIRFQGMFHVTQSKNGFMSVDDTCVLNISEGISYFFSLGSLKYDMKIKENIAKLSANGSLANANISLPTFPKCLQYAVKRRISEAETYMIRHLGEAKYCFQVDKVYAINWTVTSDTMTVNGIHCTKAIGVFDTVKVEAYFSPEISLPIGPGIYFGLPGFIAKINSSTGISMEVISFKKMGISAEANIFPDKYIMTTWTDFNKALAAYKERMKSGVPIVEGNSTTIYKSQ